MIRPATAGDLPAIEAIYNAIFDVEEAGPVYTNWQRGKYPTRDTARQVLEQGTLYVGEDEIIEQAFHVAPKDNVVFLPKVMSRKKQVIPMLSALWG